MPFRAMWSLAWAGAAALATASCDATPDAVDGAVRAFEADEGFSQPESVLHDPDADVYLVSNVAGAPVAKDGNGYISRLAPDGTMQQARWIAGGEGGVELHAPKGMALLGDTLWVADVDTLRTFDRSSGKPRIAHSIEGAQFLNDVVVAPDGEGVLVSDMRTNRIHRVGDDGEVSLFIETAKLAGANGLVVRDGTVIVVGFDGDFLLRLDAQGQVKASHATGHGRLDGVVSGPDGKLYVTSWDDKAVLQGKPDSLSVLVGELESPADLGYDSQRKRLIVPLMMKNLVVAYDLKP